ncbi:MAG TPA: hypothetical protein VIM79_01820 [Niastella sp.]
MKRTFLYQVLQHDRRLFVVMAAFAAITIATNLTGDEVTPFFVWGMYSAKEEPVQQYSILQTTINDSIVVNVYDKPISDTRFYLTSPLAHYKRIKDNSNVDPTLSFLQIKTNRKLFTRPVVMQGPLFNTRRQTDSFFPWFARYLQQVTNIPIHSIRIDEIKTHYAGPKLVVDSIHLFERWEKL